MRHTSRHSLLHNSPAIDQRRDHSPPSPLKLSLPTGPTHPTTHPQHACIYFDRTQRETEESEGKHTQAGTRAGKGMYSSPLRSSRRLGSLGSGSSRGGLIILGSRGLEEARTLLFILVLHSVLHHLLTRCVIRSWQSCNSSLTRAGLQQHQSPRLLHIRTLARACNRRASLLGIPDNARPPCNHIATAS